MQERIRALRKQLGLNQTEFGAKIGVKQTTIAGYERGSSTPLDAVVSAICREFGVSESWLRTGEGVMFVARSPDEEIAAYVAKTLRGDNDFKKAVLSLLLSRTDEELAVIERAYHELAEYLKQRKGE